MRILPLLLTICIALQATAQNIDLAAVPGRDAVQLTIYNAEDITLVRETRTLTFAPGVNTLQFSWANTLIDPTSVQIEFLDGGENLSLVDTVYPHDRPQQLYWAIESDTDGDAGGGAEATVQISYFTSGISWAADYVVTTDADEAHADVKGYVTVTNRSGEDYADASIRLVVGRINLVERIAQLAQQGFANNQPRETATRMRRNEAARGAVAQAESLAADMDGAFAGAPAVVKEGLSEYFIFSIEGQQTVPNQWSKRIRATHADAAPVDVQYRYRPRQYGNQLVKLYLLTNDTESGLGESPLPDGVVRVFRERSNDQGATSLSFVSAQSTQYIAITDDLELNLGADPDVVFELDNLYVTRDNIWAQAAARVIRRIDEPGGEARVEDRSTVVGWDDHAVYLQHIRNYTDKPIEVEVRRELHGDSTWTSSTPTELYDLHTAQYTVTVEPGDDAAVRYMITLRQGNNSKQNQLTIAEGDAPAAPWSE